MVDQSELHEKPLTPSQKQKENYRNLSSAVAVYTQEAAASRSLGLRIAWATQKSYVTKFFFFQNTKQIKMCLSITISWFLFAWSFERVALHSSSCPETYNVDQAGLESDNKIKGVCQSCPAPFYILESD